ncbi:MAG TPA: LytTR family DNA-binding domain-containing protein [Puia sp.]|nr:LytTR family DNA-binding domain-containing protein [Puia sp.]
MLLNDEIQETITSGKRVVARKGREFLVFRVEDIAYFYIENGVSYLIERKSDYKYIADKPLRDIESMIHSSSFFRVTKKYLIHINAVVKFRPVRGGKLELVLSPDPREPIIVSQLKVPSFKRWLLQN